MERWQELYQQAEQSVAHSPTPHLDPELRRIWIFMGALSDAFWRRVDEPGFSAFETTRRNSVAYQAESPDEIALWNEVTAPHNYHAVIRYVALHNGNEYAGGLVKVARDRWETEGRQGNSPAPT